MQKITTNNSKIVNRHALKCQEFMSREHISEFDAEHGRHSFDLTWKVYSQLKMRTPELGTGNIFTLKEALGKAFWKSLKKQERLNVDFCWWYLSEYFGWLVEYHSTRGNRKVYFLHPGWSDSSLLDA